MKNIWKMVIIGAVLPLAMVNLLVGCGDTDSNIVAIPGRVITNEVSSSWQNLKADAPLVVVGNRVYRKRDLEVELDGYLDQMSRAIKDPLEAKKRIEAARYDFRNSLIARFVMKSVFTLEAESRGFKTDHRDLATAWGNVSNACLAANKSFEEFCLGYPGGRKALEAEIYANTITKRLFDTVYSNRLAVTQKEIDDLHAELVRLNEDSKRTNEIYKTEIAGLRRKLIAENIVFGDDVDENAKLVPEEYTVEVFSEAPPDSFEDEEIVPGTLRGMVTNQWSAPLELENTIDLYYVSSLIARTSAHPTLFSGFRVYREKDHGYLVPDKTKLMQDVRERKNLSVVGPESERLSEKFGIIYPNGFVWDDKPASRSADAESVKRKVGR